MIWKREVGRHVRKIVTFTLITLMIMSSLSYAEENSINSAVSANNESGIIYVSPDGKADARGTKADPKELTEALNTYKSGDEIKLLEGKYELKNMVELLRPVKISGESKEKTVVNFVQNPETYGFRVGKGEGGNYSFTDLTIFTDVALSDISVQAYSEEKRVAVTIDNCILTNTSKTAIDLEGTTGNGQDTNFFDLTVKNSTITAKNYGIGSGLNNNNPIVESCNVKVENNNFNSTAASAESIYCLHFPNALKSLRVSGNIFNSASTGGIKYVFTPQNKENVFIKNNDFVGTNKDMKRNSYAIMCTNTITDVSDKYSYCWATELSGNNLLNQNLLIAARAKLEVIWVPDGQATNGTVYNNLGDLNITNEGTRYSKSAWYPESKKDLDLYFFTKCGVVLTDFDIVEDEVRFYSISEEGKTINYKYNKPSSGAYTNYKDMTQYWSETNPRHCNTWLADFDKADAITRWTVEDENVVKIEVDEDGQPVKTKEGNLSIIPIGYGTTYITATVGGGENGDMPNAKSDKIKIVVEPNSKPDDPVTPDPPIPAAPTEPENKTTNKTDDTQQYEQDTKIVETSDSSNIQTWGIVFLMSILGAATVTIIYRKRTN